MLLLAFVALQTAVAGVTAQQYFAGSVHLPGFPSNKKFQSEATNLDPVYRVPCELDGSVLVTRARRRAIELLVRWFGPIPGSYQGPYPDREMAWAAARSSSLSVPPAALFHPLVVDGQTVRLSPSDIRRALPGPSVPADSNPTVALKIFDGTCLLIGRWSDANYRVELIDTRGLGWFARYEFAPD